MQKRQSEFFGFSEADIWSDLTETWERFCICFHWTNQSSPSEQHRALFGSNKTLKKDGEFDYKSFGTIWKYLTSIFLLVDYIYIHVFFKLEKAEEGKKQQKKATKKRDSCGI